MKTWQSQLLIVMLSLMANMAQAVSVKDLANIGGVRQNQLLGYGLVVGLDGSGDQTTQTPFTVQSVASMLRGMGVNLPAGTTLQLKNVAAVMVTSSLPAFSRPGQTVDITVSSMGNAKSLRGGTLLMTPLKGADGQIYAMAQGNVLVSGAGAAVGGAKSQVNHLDVGLVPNGATVERAVPNSLGQDNVINLELKQADFATASLLVNAINQRFGSDTAAALDGRVIQVRTPMGSNQRVAFIGALESVNVTPAPGIAKVIMNARTGSVVMSQTVMLDPCAVSHGNLSVIIKSTPEVSQPVPFSRGKTIVTQTADIEIKSEPGQVMMLKGGAQLSDVVKALNAMGTTPQDLLAILQAMKSAGALRADLEII